MATGDSSADSPSDPVSDPSVPPGAGEPAGPASPAEPERGEKSSASERSHRRRIYLIAASCGAFGVLSGYAIFLYYRQVYEEPEVSPLRVAGALFVAAAISYLIEWLREVIRFGEIENKRHPLIRSMGTFVVVLLFELFITGFHAAGETLNRKVLSDLATKLIGGSDAPGSSLSLVLASGAWVVVGALLAGSLSRGVEDAPHPLRTELWRRCGHGLKAGLAIAPLALLGYLLLSRSLLAFQNLVYQYDSWGAVTGAFLQSDLIKNFAFKIPVWNVAVAVAAVPTVVMGIAAHHGTVVFLASFVALLFVPRLILHWVPTTSESLWVIVPILLALGCFAGTILPFLVSLVLALWPILKPALPLASLSPFHLAVPAALPWFSFHPFALRPYAPAGWATWAMLEAMLLACIIWGVPGMLFGMLVPLLRRQARHSRNWAFIGYAAAALMIVASLLTRNAWPLAPAGIAVLAGVLFHRGISIEEYWPFAALCVAFGVCGATSITQQLTFAGVAKNLHTLDVLPAAPVPARFDVIAQRQEQQREDDEEQTKRDDEAARDLDQYDLDHGLNDPSQANGPCRAEALRLVVARKDWEQIAGTPEGSSGLGPQAERAYRRSTQERYGLRQQQLDACVAAHPAASHRPAPGHDQPRQTDSGVPEVLPPGLESSGFEPSKAAEANAAPKPEANAAQSSTEPAHPRLDAVEAAKALEIAITGSVGFWITVGLLACWSLFEHEHGHSAAGDATEESARGGDASLTQP